MSVKQKQPVALLAASRNGAYGLTGAELMAADFTGEEALWREENYQKYAREFIAKENARCKNDVKDKKRAVVPS
jgi:hypothetical protein